LFISGNSIHSVTISTLLEYKLNFTPSKTEHWPIVQNIVLLFSVKCFFSPSNWTRRNLQYENVLTSCTINHFTSWCARLKKSLIVLQHFQLPCILTGNLFN